MKAIHVIQPWAELIMQGRKTLELRGWRPAYRGPLAIRATRTILRATSRQFGLDPDQLPTGVILGAVDLVAVIEFDLETWRATRDQHLNNAYGPGDWVGWQLEAPRRLATPLRHGGLRGMFTLPEEIAAQLQFAED